MTQEVTNFARFYDLLRQMPFGGDRDELKRQLVREGTQGRTESLREIRRREYDRLLQSMERALPRDRARDIRRDNLRLWRSVCLKLLQQVGVDTTSWAEVNRYCKSPKIAGTEFRNLDEAALTALAKKLRVILKKKSEKLTINNEK